MGDRLRPDSALEREFHGEMKAIYEKARREAGYQASYFIRMVSERGGLAAARALLPKQSDGFTELWTRHRLDLSVEALVLQPRFAVLFTEDELETARRRLAEHGYRHADVLATSTPAPPPDPSPAARPAPLAGHRPPAASAESLPGWDFFVSYTRTDRETAEWIAWQLEESGYKILFQAWDFVPGSHWLKRMDEGMRESRRTVAVLSHAYLGSVYGRTEWEAAYQGDPQGFIRKLIPVRVEDCPRPGLLGSIVSIDIFGLAETEARALLLTQISGALSGRAKPTAAPAFPRALAKPPARRPEAPGLGGLRTAYARSGSGHTGKYRALAEWLARQDADRIPATFEQVEAILGMPLPESSRRYPAHWSGYKGSAVARAIRDAGWAARQVDISGQRLVFVRIRG